MSTTMTRQIPPDIYQAAHETAVLVNHSAAGMLKFTGATRLDLVHRMSTQAVKKLQTGEGAATILTTDIGRIIDRIVLYAASEAVYALTGDGNADPIARYLLRFVFFNDDFQLQDLSQETAVFGVYGPQAGQKLGSAGFPETDLPRHHWRKADVGGVTAYLHRADPIAGDGYLVTAQAADKERLQIHLLTAGLVLAAEPAYEYLRIESGQPRFGRELTQEYIPLEANLWDDVSFKKGCYIGQEIIARLESRGKLAKRLARLALAAPAEPGSDITADGKRAGTLTSVGYGPAGALGLGYVKTAVLDNNLPLMVGETAVTLL
jgi:folate-binding protein YgfZ